MKPSVTVTLGAALFGILLAAYIFAYATTFHDPVEWKDGDLIIQNASASNALPVFQADGSGMVNVGIVDARDGGSVVIEVTDKVVETPVATYLTRNENAQYWVYRVTALSDGQRAKVVEAALRQLGKSSDVFMRWNLDKLYSTELVRLAYADIGFDLGRLQKISKIGRNLDFVERDFQAKWTSDDVCRKRNLDVNGCWDLTLKQEVVTPSSLAQDVNVTKIFEAKFEPAIDWFTVDTSAPATADAGTAAAVGHEASH